MSQAQDDGGCSDKITNSTQTIQTSHLTLRWKLFVKPHIIEIDINLILIMIVW